MDRFKPRDYKKFSCLTPLRIKFNPAHKCYKTNICWHFNIYKQDRYNIIELYEDLNLNVKQIL